MVSRVHLHEEVEKSLKIPDNSVNYTENECIFKVKSTNPDTPDQYHKVDIILERCSCMTFYNFDSCRHLIKCKTYIKGLEDEITDLGNIEFDDQMIFQSIAKDKVDNEIIINYTLNEKETIIGKRL